MSKITLKLKPLMIGGPVLIVVLAFVYLSWQKQKPDITNQTHVNEVVILVEPNKVKAPAIVPAHKAKAKTMPVDKAMQDNLMNIADIYEIKSKFAPYSFPLSASQTDLINPNQTFEAERNYSAVGLNVAMKITPEKYRFTTTESISATVTVRDTGDSLEHIYGLRFNLVDLAGNELIPFNTVSVTNEDATRTYELSAVIAEQITSQEMLVRAELETYNGKVIVQTAPVKVVKTVAEITSIGAISVEENNLVIPINISAEKGGYYQVTGSLFDKKTDKPVAYIIAKSKLSSGSGTIEAKVHGYTLKSQKMAGPFIFKGITVVKKSEGAGMTTTYGNSDQEYSINKIHLDDFEATEFEDPMAKMRLSFLKKIAGQG